MKTRFKIGITALFICLCTSLNAQTTEGLIRKGNNSYENKDYDAAVTEYKASLDKEYNDKALFNLGDAYYQRKDYDSAMMSFSNLTERKISKEMASDAHYNIGNCLLEQQKYEEAFNEYKQSLLLNPDNEDARYNLEYARQKIVIDQQ